MAEFCLDCTNKYLMEENNQLTKEDVTMDMDFCEGCGEWKPCVIAIKNGMSKNLFIPNSGATGQNRTDNLLITNELLCH